MSKLSKKEIRQAVRDTYSKIASSTAAAGCSCSCGCDNQQTEEEIARAIGYSDNDVNSVPQGTNMGLGCGNPLAIASLKPGETVVDLGSGGGFDCFLAAKAVGAAGHVIGVDMTPKMINKARENAIKARVANVEFRLGQIESLPLDDNTVDVIISNCVINLSPEKNMVFREIYRVLKSGGRLQIADIVAWAPLPEKIKRDLALHAGCVAGAAPINELKKMLEDAGFAKILITPVDTAGETIPAWGPESKIEDFVVSATIEAVKP